MMIQLITLVDCWALLCRSHEQKVPAGGALWSAVSRHTHSPPALITSSALYYSFSSQLSFFFTLSPSLLAIPLSLSLFQLNNGIEHPSRVGQRCRLLLKESFSGSMCQSAGIGALVESIWHGEVELYYCVPGNMKCSSMTQKCRNVVDENRGLRP